jgi:protein-S-isoprenylcysteine O-methyltransferase Ste14
MVKMVINIVTIISIVAFYLIYFGKMTLQRKQGIITNQMSKGNKAKGLIIQESIMRLITLVIVPIEIISIILLWTKQSDTIRYIGSVVEAVGVFIFFISIYTMRDSWRAGITEEKTELITSGVYQHSRNPAFIGFYLLYVGILLSYFNFYLLVVTVLAIISLHLQILHEEKSLLRMFGPKYTEYMKKVRRYVGRKR